MWNLRRLGVDLFFKFDFHFTNVNGKGEGEFFSIISLFRHYMKSINYFLIYRSVSVS